MGERENRLSLLAFAMGMVGWVYGVLGGMGFPPFLSISKLKFGLGHSILNTEF